MAYRVAPNTSSNSTSSTPRDGNPTGAVIPAQNFRIRSSTARGTNSASSQTIRSPMVESSSRQKEVMASPPCATMATEYILPKIKLYTTSLP